MSKTILLVVLGGLILVAFLWACRFLLWLITGRDGDVE